MAGRKKGAKNSGRGKSGDEPKSKKVKRGYVEVKDEGDGDNISDGKNNGDAVASCEETEVDEKKWMPKNWPQAYENIKKMMEGVTAPLESMPWYQAYDPAKTSAETRFRVLVALMLSSQTKDEQTLKTWNNLCDKGLSVDWIIKTDEAELSELIKTVNFRKNKAKYLKKTAEICAKDYNDDIPDTLEGLTRLPGVGNKMAFLVLQSCWAKPDGLGVDVHVHRLANRLGWVRKPTKDADKTRIELESWVPKEIWFDFNRFVTRFGQMKCTPRNPDCDGCLNNKICPSAFKA